MIQPIDNDWKILSTDLEKGQYEVYNLKDDPKETADLSSSALDGYKPYFTEWRKLPAYSDWLASRVAAP